MCLSKITKRVKGTKEEKWGWKVFEQDSYGIHFPFGKLKGSTKVEIGKWLKAEPILGWDSEGYDSGFHIFDSKKGAVEYQRLISCEPVVIKVKYRKETVIGIQHSYNQHSYKVVVAKEMFVVSK